QPPNVWKVACTLKVSDLGTGKELLSLPCQPDEVARMDLSPDGSRLAVALWTGPAFGPIGEGQYRVKLLEVPTGKEVWAGPVISGSFAHGLHFSPDGARLVIGRFQKGDAGE